MQRKKGFSGLPQANQGAKSIDDDCFTAMQSTQKMSSDHPAVT